MESVIWTDADALRLKTLRTQAGLDVSDLSKKSAVSVAQINQLEQGGDSLFYTPVIKYSVGKRLTLILIQLKNEPLSEPLIDDRPLSSRAMYSKELQAIEEMSRRNLDARPLADALTLFKINGLGFFQSRYVQASLMMVALMLSISLYESWQEVDSAWKSNVVYQYVAQQWQDWDPWWMFKGDPLIPDHASSNAMATSKQNQAQLAVPASVIVSNEASSLAVADKLAVLPNSNGLEQTGKVEGFDGHVQTLNVSQAPMCQFESQGEPLESINPIKASNYVYLVALKAVDICVQDARHRIVGGTLEVGKGQTIIGSAPWQIKSASWPSLQVYFQGRRINWPEHLGTQVTLVPAGISSTEVSSNSTPISHP